jgi:NAD(P)-dependent dehydrogenase (short-subunit alcohol dehydrogenase family)
MGDLDGRTALLTGASRAISEATARVTNGAGISLGGDVARLGDGPDSSGDREPGDRSRMKGRR